MTNKIEISRELADRLTRAYPAEITDQETMQAIRIEALSALDELRALLAAPAVEPEGVLNNIGRSCGGMIWHECQTCKARGSYHPDVKWCICGRAFDAPAVERQEPDTHKCQKCYGHGVVPTRHAGEGETEYRDRCKLYTSPPEPVAVVHPELGSTPEDHMRWLLDKIVNPGDYPQSVLHDQIRSTLACLDKVKEMNK